MTLSKHDARIIHDYVSKVEREAFLEGVEVGAQSITRPSDYRDNLQIIFNALRKYMKENLSDDLEYWQKLVDDTDKTDQ